MLRPDPIAGIQTDETVTSPNEALTRLSQNMEAQDTLIQETVVESGALFFDVTPALQTAIVNGAEPYFYGDVHLSQAGHEVVGKALRDFLQANQLLPSPH